MLDRSGKYVFKQSKDNESSAKHKLISQELRAGLRRPSCIDDFVSAVVGNAQLNEDFDLRHFIRICNLDDQQSVLFAVSFLDRNQESPISKDGLARELLMRFQPLLRQMGLKNATEHIQAFDIAYLARKLLLPGPCSQILSAVQKFVIEYAIFQRFQYDLPSEILSFFFDYNELRTDDDHSKSLAQLFDETRGAGTTSVTSAEQLLKRRGILQGQSGNEAQIVDLILTLVSSSYSPGSWSGENLGKALHRMIPDLSWTSIVHGLDRDDLEIGNMDELNLLLSIFKAAISSGAHDVPVPFLWAHWRHSRAQASLLRQLTQASTSIFNITDFSGRTVLCADDFVSAPAHLKNLAAQLETSPWNSLELLRSSLRLLSTEDAAQETKHFLEAAGKSTPELIFLGCIQLPHPWSAQQEQLSEKGCEVFFGGQPNHQLVFYRLWQVDPEFLCRKFINYHNKDSLNVTRVLDIAQELRILDELLNLQPYSFVIDLAALASGREHLNLEKWLDHHISNGRDGFIEAVLRYMSYKAEAENIVQQSDGNSVPVTVSLRVETVAIFLKVLMNTVMSSENGEILKQVQSACLQVYPRLMNSANANRDPLDSNNFAKDVEKEVEFYYGRLYEGDMSIANFVEMLQTLKCSSDIRDQDVFACMLHSLFDEYRFFADYPLSALSITAVLFGSLIQHQLLAYIPLGIALRYILDAVGHETNSNMFRFGVQALRHFKDRVPLWPQYCQQILAVPGLADCESDLIESIRNLEQHSSDAHVLFESETAQVLPISSGDLLTPVRKPFRSLSSGSSLKDTTFYLDPSEETCDKILFNINNMSLTNLSEKLEEVRSVLTEQYFAWFANHLVSQRAAVEPNYHSLYIHFLHQLQNEHLLHRILQETVENISILLNSESTITSTVERTNLKNLGSWLGGLTLARNQPLKHKMISLKNLLLEGFDENRLIVVLPFVCRVLEQTANSKVFRPPCPWTLAILGVLMELYETAEMKLNLKFEVEVLCKKLSVQMSDVPKSSILRNRPLLPNDPHYTTGTLDGFVNKAEISRRGVVENVQDQSTAFVAAAVADMPITIHPVVQQNFAVPNLRRLLISAAERAIREFILPVVERSVAVASISTSQLVSKDFAFEEDVIKFRRAAHTMNQNLAGSLALVTCKEPLRGAFTTNLRMLLAQSGFEGLSQEGETLLVQLINDNLDVACMVVEKAACERAITEIDEGLAAGYQARRKHFESKTTSRFSDSSAPRHTFPLPDPLRLRSTGLTTDQMSTYDDFARIPRNAREAALYYSKEEARHLAGEQDGAQYRNGELHTGNSFEQILASLTDVDTLARELELGSIEDIPADSPIRLLLQHIPLYLSGLTGPVRDERTLTCSQRVCQLLFKTPYSSLAAQCLTLLLNHFVELSIKTFRDVSVWLVHSEDLRKYNVPVIHALIRAQIIVPSEFDVQLAKQIYERKPAAIEFGVGLIIEAVLGTLPVALRSDFTASLCALEALTRQEQIPLLEEFFVQLQSSLAIPNFTEHVGFPQDTFISDQLSLVFMEWVHLISHPATNRKIQLAYVLQLQSCGITTDDDLCAVFFRTVIEQSIESATRMMPSNSNATTAHYLVIDAVAKLVMTMIVHQRSSDSLHSALENFQRFLGILVLTFVHDHSSSDGEFNQKPFFRLFASLLSEIDSNSSVLGELRNFLLVSLCQTFQVLQPLHFPAFTFAWTTLISHRLFLPKLLQNRSDETWSGYCDLLIALLRYLSPALSVHELSDSSRLIYHALLRILLVLLNDFPGLLDEHHYKLMNIIP